MKIILAFVAISASLASCERQPAKVEAAPVAVETAGPPVIATHAPTGRKILVNGNEIVVGNDDSVDVSFERRREEIGGRIDRNEKISASGVGLETSSASAEQNFNTDPVSVTLGGLVSSVGGTNYSGKLIGLKKSNIFYVMGICTILGAVVFAAFVRPIHWGAVITLGAGGVLIIGIGVMVNEYPWLWVLLPLALIGALVAWIVHARVKVKLANDNSDKDATLAAIVSAISRAPDEIKNFIKKSIVEEAGTDKPVVEKVITDTKIKQDL